LLSRRDRLISAIAGVLAVVVAALVLTSTFGGSSDQPQNPSRLRPGDSPPDFVLPELAAPARFRASSDYFGRPTVITFLASTCVPCRKELPILQDLSEQYRGRLNVVGIAHLEFRDPALRFVTELGVTFPVLHDEPGEVAVAWFVPGLPATFFLDGSGRVVRSIIGPASASAIKSGVDAVVR
jgi:cytochrome c biogenesis protein CcmG, thiol:disulfide interchange protein DsbE